MCLAVSVLVYEYVCGAVYECVSVWWCSVCVHLWWYVFWCVSVNMCGGGV